MKQIQYKGFKMVETKEWTYKVSADNGKYTAECKTFGGATEWLNEMAPNNDFAETLMHKICDKFECDVYGNSSRWSE